MLYTCVIRNEHTGELRVLTVESVSPEDAQVEALRRMFHAEGWRKATALTPEERDG